MTYEADCALNSSHDERYFPSCQPPNTNIDDDDDDVATAESTRGANIDAASAVSPVSKQTTSTVEWPS